MEKPYQSYAELFSIVPVARYILRRVQQQFRPWTDAAGIRLCRFIPHTDTASDHGAHIRTRHDRRPSGSNTCDTVRSYCTIDDTRTYTAQRNSHCRLPDL